VGIRTCRQNLETVSPRPRISRLRPFQIRWATRSPLLCRCAARNLGFSLTPSPRGEGADGSRSFFASSIPSNSRNTAAIPITIQFEQSMCPPSVAIVERTA
jgi:hypothetical protein